MAVIAEGVESLDERDTLAAAGCDLFQGFLFSEPRAAFPQPRWLERTPDERLVLL
jgi:EAL domain-containing protein (putative c-di-GMP-specific phosphodiesterase class I)